MLETYTKGVYVESPPSEDLPIFNRTHVPSTDIKTLRQIFLRPRDTVFFDDSCALRISVVHRDHSNTTSFAEDNNAAAATEIQVKSSAHQPTAVEPGAAQNSVIADEDMETDDEDDLDAPLHTPIDVENATPATSRPTDNLAVKDTPSRPFSRDSNHIFSTAPDKLQPPDFTDATNAADSGILAARAGAKRDKETGMKSSEEIDSQFVFPNSKAQTTYGGTPIRQRSAKKEIAESPSKSDVPSETLEHPDLEPANVSSSNRKRSIAEFDEGDDDKSPAPAELLTKKPRGRPPKASHTPKPRPTKSSKALHQSGESHEAEDAQNEAVEAPPSTGKLKRPGRRSKPTAQPEEEDDIEDVASVNPRGKPNASPDLDPRASSTPQSSGVPMSGKAPSKVLLSNSKFAEDTKAKNWLKKHGAAVDDSIPSKRSNFVCVVGTGELAKTAKMVRSLALGKKVVTDQWLKDSMQQDQLLDLDEYIHDDLADTMHINRSKLFSGKALFVTPALAKAYGSGFAHIKELAAAVGAHRVESGPAHKAAPLSDAATIFLGFDSDDLDALKLTEEEGKTVYQRDLLTQSIIRGELLTNDDEFEWKPNSAKGKKGKK